MSRRRQCNKCPWRKDANPRDIPNGYSEKAHRALASTIAVPGLVCGLRMMACHDTPVGKELPCVGWLINQLGEGNNISLRMAVIDKRVSADVELVGEQHACLEDTFPKRRRRART